MTSSRRIARFAPVALIALLAACGNTAAERGITGGALGAAAGAAAGAVTGGSAATGAVIGGAVGAAAGALSDRRDLDLGDSPF
ncbi:MAG: YMGG-like glycine zipper-containing protein [Pseudomonadota bacterium]